MGGGVMRYVRMMLPCAQGYYMHGMTPLIMASNQGHLEVVKALLAADADKEARAILVGSGEAKYLGRVGGGSWGGRGGKAALCVL